MFRRSIEMSRGVILGYEARWSRRFKNYPDMLDQTGGINWIPLVQNDKGEIGIQIPNSNFYMGTATYLEEVQWNESLMYREYLYEEHGFRIVSFESAPPIENQLR